MTEEITSGMMAEPGPSFGGPWTELKLEMVKNYLDAYSQALKKQQFGKIYIDAFAGTGYREMVADEQSTPVLWEEAEAEANRIFAGSAKLSLQVEPPFNQYIFIEKSAKRLSDLKGLRDTHSELAHRVEIRQDDANHAIPELCQSIDWRKHRAVMFLDPYGMAVEWSTMEAIARTRAIDVWILFPVGIGVNRLLPDHSSEIPSSWRALLDRVFGTPEWQNAFYKTDVQGLLFPEETTEMIKVGEPIQAIAQYYQERLASIFPQVTSSPRFLLNKRHSPLFLLTFAVASKNPKAQKLALRISHHILTRTT